MSTLREALRARPGLRTVAAVVAVVVGMLGLAVPPAPATACAAGCSAHAHRPNLLANAGFEAGEYRVGRPYAWTNDSWVDEGARFAWSRCSHRGRRSVQITLTEPNDALWLQTVSVRPHSTYRLTGWIRTRGVASTAEIVDAGATLGVYGRWDRTRTLVGTHRWTFVSMHIESGTDAQLTIAARLGFWAGTTTGRAWFDDLRLVRIG